MLDEPIDEPDLRRLLRYALNHGEVRFTQHAFEEMSNDGLVEQDIRNCLWAGRFDGCDFERRTWRYRIRAGRLLTVVAFRGETVVVVVTAWKEGR